MLNRRGPCHQFSYFHNNEQTQNSAKRPFLLSAPLAGRLPRAERAPDAALLGAPGAGLAPLTRQRRGREGETPLLYLAYE